MQRQLNSEDFLLKCLELVWFFNFSFFKFHYQGFNKIFSWWALDYDSQAEKM